MCSAARLLGVVVVALAGGAILWSPLGVLTIRVLRPASTIMQACRVGTDSQVRLGYLHSVEKTPVEGRFSVGADHMLLAVETRFVSTGTGLPDTAVSRTRRDGHWLVVDEERHPLPALRFYLHTDNQTRLSVDGQAVDLGAFDSANLLRIGVESVPRWRWWVWTTTGRAWGPEAEPSS
jgi:hypothetical protein